jgi:hypothetical protein
MKFEDLKQGSFIKWEANRMYKSWNTFGKVLLIAEDNITILTYDDFKETTISKHGDALKGEISLCDEEEVFDYMQLRMTRLNAKKIEIEIEFNKEIHLIDKQIAKLLEIEFA